MISPEAAWQSVAGTVIPLPAVSRAYTLCLHHVLAQAIRADRDIPVADRAAMDGYALRADDAAVPPATLRLAGEVAAGSDARPPLAMGECVRILTGANVPPDADAVVRVEDTTAVNEAITFLKPVRPGQQILRRGENAREGDVLLEAGTVLNAGGLALCASVGCTQPQVHDRPRVAVITTGSELRPADEPVEAHQIRDVNGPMLVASLAENGFDASGCCSVPDDRDQLLEVLRQATGQNHVTLVSGGVSVGRYDFVPDVVRELGGQIHYHGVAMKPGKPQLYATFGPDRYLFGLPGNPLAVLTGLHEFALPALRRLGGCPLEACRPLWRLPLADDVTTKGPRRHYLIARLVMNPAGMTVAPVPNSGSSDFVAGCQAQGMIMLPDGATALPAGTVVDFRPWRNV